jgi:hypothetical protein
MRPAVLALLLLASGGSAVAQDPIVRLSVTPEDVAVGESAQMQVTVLVPTWFSEPPVYPSFELANSIVRLPPDSSYPTSERVGRETWSGIVRNYRVYPLISGRFRLGGQGVRVSYANPGSAPIAVDVPLPEATLSATVPQGAEELDPYLAGRSLMLTRDVEGDLDDLEAGDAIVVRTVAELDGLPAMFLPPLSPELAFEGVAVYADEPVVEDGDVARRTEKVTLVFESGGDFTLPGIELDWWDMTSQSVVTAMVPEVSFAVAGPVAEPVAAEDAPVRDWRAILVETAGWLAALFVAWRVLRRLTARAQRRAAERRESEPYAFRRFGKACGSGNARKAHHAMLAWLERLQPGLTASGFAQDWGDESLVRKLDAFSAAVYRDGEESVQLDALYRGLGDARQSYLGDQSVDARPALPPLNP